ncbi:MAG: hypothetical protein ACREBK_01845 [Sphingomicrobium sp.]
MKKKQTGATSKATTASKPAIRTLKMRDSEASKVKGGARSIDEGMKESGEKAGL